ncbi:MAG: hypothetical protein K6G73_03710 [Marinilabiliaceae bacterium]|nr:hypothetical protein [Marinilabiliaceae bacterium]
MFLQKLRTLIGHNINNKKRVRPCTLPNRKLTDISKILIIADVAEKETTAAINNLKQKMKSICPKAELSFVCFYEPNATKETLISYNGCEYITKKDFSFFFKIRNENLRNYITREYDMAIFLTSTHNPYLEFIGAYIRARLKVGKRSNDDGQFNFMIDSKSDSILQLSNDIVSNLKMVFGD